MSNELDTSWFDLKKYDRLKNLDLKDWYYQLSIRNTMLKYTLRQKDRKSLNYQCIKKTPIIGSDIEDSLIKRYGESGKKLFKEIKPQSSFLKYDSTYPFNTYSVNSITALDYWEQIENHKLSDIWEDCKACYSFNEHDYLTPDELLALKSTYELEEIINNDNTKTYRMHIIDDDDINQKARIVSKKLDNIRDSMKEKRDKVRTPLNIILKNRDSHYKRFNVVTVDLTAPDEQIIKDFQHWLTEYRKLTGSGEKIKKQYESNENNFNKNNCLDWAESQVLPYIDLMLIAEFEGKKITQAKIGELIFPNEYGVDLAGRIRQTTKPKADWLLMKSTLKAIDAQIRSAL